MKNVQQWWLFALRISLGWLFFYAGITKVINPDWSAEGFLNNASTFPGLYAWFASPGVLPVTNALNEWGLTLIGAALFIGAFVRPAGYLGAVMMVLYYFPGMEFPKVNTHYFLVDYHIIIALSLLVLASFKAGHVWGVAPWLAKRFKRCRDWV